MNLWDKSPAKVLGLLLSSTAHKFHFSEIVDGSSLARGTVSSVLKRLHQAKVVLREEERFHYDPPFRAPYVYYTVNPVLIEYLRLQAPST